MMVMKKSNLLPADRLDFLDFQANMMMIMVIGKHEGGKNGMMTDFWHRKNMINEVLNVVMMFWPKMKYESVQTPSLE